MKNAYWESRLALVCSPDPILNNTNKQNMHLFFSHVPNIPRLPSFSVHATITLTSDKMIFYCYQLPAPLLFVFRLF